jgi:hypothetical protein
VEMMKLWISCLRNWQGKERRSRYLRIMERNLKVFKRKRMKKMRARKMVQLQRIEQSTTLEDKLRTGVKLSSRIDKEKVMEVDSRSRRKEQ